MVLSRQTVTEFIVTVLAKLNVTVGSLPWVWVRSQPTHGISQEASSQTRLGGM